MKVLIAILLAAVTVGFGIRAYRLRRRSSAALKKRSTINERRRIEAKIAENPPEIEKAPEPIDNDLSDSGVISVGDEIDRFIAAGLWGEALKWSNHALDSRPDSIKFRMKLAEVHFGIGSKEEFRILFDDLREQVPEGSDLHDKLYAMAIEILPDHPAVSSYSRAPK
jgi:hypothetical protein